MVCPNCAYDNSANNRFCVRCGVDLSVSPTPETPSFAVGPGADPAGAPTAPAAPPPPAPAAAPGAPAPPNPWGAPPPASPWAAPPGQTPPPPPPPHGSAPGAPPNPFAPPAPYGPPGAYPPPGPYAQYPPSYPPSGYQTASTNGLAIASFILGLVGWMACGVGSVVAIVLGFVARSQIRGSHGRQGGDGLALAGIILGFIAIALVVVFFVIGTIASSNNGQY
jgi:Domain of unknown function (DUF4190)